MKGRPHLLLPALLALALASAAAAEPSPPVEPNFIVILTDDQGWAGSNVPMDPAVDRSSSDCFETPQLGRLAGMGLRFAQGYSSAPKCAPATSTATASPT